MYGVGLASYYHQYGQSRKSKQRASDVEVDMLTSLVDILGLNYSPGIKRFANGANSAYCGTRIQTQMKDAVIQYAYDIPLILIMSCYRRKMMPLLSMHHPTHRYLSTTIDHYLNIQQC